MLPTLRLQKSHTFLPPPNRESEGVAGGGVRVWLMDESYKAMHVDVDQVSVEDLWNLVCDKLGLSPAASECFYVFGCGKELELLLVGEDKLSAVMRSWIPTEHKYFPWVSFEGFAEGAAVAPVNDKEAAADKAAADARVRLLRADLISITFAGEGRTCQVVPFFEVRRLVHFTLECLPIILLWQTPETLRKSGAIPASNSNGTNRVVERPSPVRFFLKTTEVSPLLLRKKAMADKIGLRLLYIEAVYYVLKGWYPVSQQQAVRLGGLQLQAYVGDSGPAHAPGFLTTENNWKNYVPSHLRHSTKSSPQQWEVVLLAEHVKHRGKHHDACMTEYLNVVMELPVYGSTFYNVKVQSAKTAFFSHEFDSSVILAVNDMGIHIVDAFSMKFETYSHGSIKDWKASEKYVTIVLSGEDKKKIKLKSRQSDLINELLGAWQAEWRGSKHSARTSQRRSVASDNDSPV